MSDTEIAAETAGARPTGRRVGAGAAFGLSYRLVLRQLTSTGRIIALTLLALIAPLSALALGASDASLDDAVNLVASIGLGLVIPVVTLVFGGAAIGDLRDDKTLVYLWLRPMDRWPIVVGAAAWRR